MENKSQEQQNKSTTEQLPKEESNQEIKEQSQENPVQENKPNEHTEENKENKPNESKEAEEKPKEEERAPPAEGEDVVWIEYCQNCKSHGWCTRHDEKKYLWFFQKLREKIEGETGIRVEMAAIKPALGSFEVKFNETLIFSKIATLQWPFFEEIMEKLKEAQENPPQKDEEGNENKEENGENVEKGENEDKGEKDENGAPKKDANTKKAQPNSNTKSNTNTKKPSNTQNKSQTQKKAPSNNVPKYDLIQTPQKNPEVKNEDPPQKSEITEDKVNKEKSQENIQENQPSKEIIVQ